MRIETFDRPIELTDLDDPSVLFARSYLLTRAIIGGLGIALPIALMLAETTIDQGVRARGSLSAYYHTGARDLFVGALCVIGVMLLTYLAGRPRTADARLSSLAGAAVLVVAFVPTARPGLPADAASCVTTPAPASCAPLQRVLGEGVAAGIHYTAAGVFVLSLTALCFVFARRETRFQPQHQGLARTWRTCGTLILAAIVWIGLGGLLRIDLGPLRPLYVGEVVAVWSFGIAWLLKSRDLLRLFAARLTGGGRPRASASGRRTT